AGDYRHRAAVPLLGTGGSCALVIGARHPDGRHHALETELLDPRRIDIEVLKPPAELLAGQRLLTELLLRDADSFYPEHGSDEPSIVEDLSDLVALCRSFSLGIGVAFNVGMHREFAGTVLEHKGLVAGRIISGRPHVGLRAGPPDADHLVA